MKVVGNLIKILLVIALLGLVVIIYQTCAGNDIIQRIDKTEPSQQAAIFEVPTKTRTYLAQKAVLNSDNSVTMINWYEKDGGKWVYHEGSITLPSMLRPRVQKR